ncbi:hypothetical protein AAIR98_001782 [Elusimicrobium simillimum]|uniref:peptidase MA family metallohydrolase n=1 Tax=Elusimicrobium simillimum TaxID=3143438 RepID=UPI003C6ECF5E
MDIVKKLQIIFWFLAALLIVPPVLHYFDIPLNVAVRRVLMLPPEPEKEPEVIDHDTVHQVFGIAKSAAEESIQEALPHTKISLTPEEYTAQTTDIKDRITGLEKYASLAKNPEFSTSGVPPVFEQKKFTNKIKWIGPPSGFTTKETYNFMVYREKKELSPKMAALLNKIHGNLMLDLLPFTMVVKPSKILLMMFSNQESYSSFTQRPPWSGAAADIERDTLYVVENDGFYPLSVHELTHLYFDGFFLPGQAPLWLSEGMAVYMQSHTAHGEPEWVKRSVAKFKKGQYMAFEDFVKITSLENFTSEQAEMWYSQSYSIVKYMMNMRTRDDFYKFCVNIKSDMPEYQALYRAYGLPFTRFSVLENVWLHDLQKTEQTADFGVPPQTRGAPARPQRGING